MNIITIFTRIVAQGYYYFLPKNEDKALQIVLHCDIIWGCATIKFYTHMHTTILNITFLLSINGNSYNSFNCLQLCNMWESYTQSYMNAQYRWALRSNHSIFVVVVIMAEYIVWHILKAITYHHLLLKICTCSTIRGCTTIKINHENKLICTRIVTHCATIWICTTNQVNTVTIISNIGMKLILSFKMLATGLKVVYLLIPMTCTENYKIYSKNVL